jgi:hypothetical protein
MSKGQELTSLERESLRLEAKRLEDSASLLNKMLSSGTDRLRVENLEISNGDVILDRDGIYVRNNQEAGLTFENATGERRTIYLVSGLGNELAIVNVNPDGEIQLRQAIAGQEDFPPLLRLYEDPEQAGRLLAMFSAQGGDYGPRLVMGNGVDQGGWLDLQGGASSFSVIKLRAEGTTSGSTYMNMLETSNTPPSPTANIGMNIYIKGDKLIIQFNEGGTVRYKYLDLTGTGVTWTHTTTAP